jgi:predicted nuclease of predicted toxin-antitoxin system
MRIKLDENLPMELVTQLQALGHDVESVYTEHLSGSPDPDVWRAAQSERRLLITQDIGFGDARMFTPGAHAGFVLIRLKRAGRQALIAKVRGVFETADVEAWSGCFVVVSDSKLRVRHPPNGR